MSSGRELERPSIDPLFADILSGEFFPAIDPQRGSHSLSRLAGFTMRDGDPMRIANHPVMAYQSSPNWAAGLLVVVSCAVNPDYASSQLRDLHILHKAIVMGITYTPENEHAAAHVKLTIDEERVDSYGLELEEEVLTAKLAVTDAARAYFISTATHLERPN